MSYANLVYKDLVARGKRLETAKQWRAWIMRFEECCGVKDSYGRSDVMKFVAELREDGISQNSINTIIKPVKLLCQIQGWKDGFPKLAMARVRRSDVSRPRLSVDDIGYIIRRAKEVCSEREVAFLAVATTYGLRRGEVGTVEIIDGSVRIYTLKGGEVTTQLIPDEIKDFIKGYRGCDSLGYMSAVFRTIIDKVGIEVGVGFGWDSIRRALATELMMRDVSLLNMARFMRWSVASLQREVGMLAIYAVRDQAEIDRSIFEVHPFLPFW